jgi:mRNA-degrading endonuclease RelE of RelBE toxin-antitoxin system
MTIDIAIKQMPLFKKAYKKLHKNERSKVDEAIRKIAANPELGEGKKGDLAGVFVYKFKIHTQQMLLAYEWEPNTRILLALGVHENFYRDLKKLH